MGGSPGISLGTKKYKEERIKGAGAVKGKKSYFPLDNNHRRDFGIPNTPEHRKNFISQIEAIDIWSGLQGQSIEGLDLSENNFWFAHPVYFASCLAQEGLLTAPRVRNLIRAQDEVVALPCLLGGRLLLPPNGLERYRHGRGIYSQEMAGTTFCNHAVYINIRAVDALFGRLIGLNNLYGMEDPPWNIEQVNEEFRRSITNSDGEYIYRSSTIWYDILEEQTRLGILVRLTEEQAQEYANMGYIVIGAWKNASGNNSPHYATVRPGFNLNADGAMPANVGGTNGIIRVSDGFRRIPRANINWYYNSNQSFRYLSNEVLKYLSYR